MNYGKFSLTCICWNNVQCVYYTLYSWNFSPKCIIDIISSYEVSTFTNRIHTQIQSQISLFLDSALKFNYFKYRLLQYHQSTNSDSNFTFILYQLSAITIPWESKSGFLLTFVGSFLGMCGVKILDNDAQIASETLWPIYSCFIFLKSGWGLRLQTPAAVHSVALRATSLTLYATTFPTTFLLVYIQGSLHGRYVLPSGSIVLHGEWGYNNLIIIFGNIKVYHRCAML